MLLVVFAGHVEPGEVAPATGGEDHPPGRDLAVRVVTGAGGVKVELVRDGVVSLLGERAEGLALVETRLTGLKAGERLYVRVIDAEGGAAWSSPWFVE